MTIEYLHLLQQYLTGPGGIPPIGITETDSAVQQKRLTIIAKRPYSFSYPSIWSFGYQTDTESFYFIDLNEDSDDPDVHYTWLYEKQDRTGTPRECIEKTQYTFSGFIEASINYYLVTNDRFPH